MTTTRPQPRDVLIHRLAQFGRAKSSLFDLLGGAAFLALCLTGVSLQAQSGSASVEGRVQNAANGNFLNNARVAVEGTTIETLTNGDGEYRLMKVPAGQVRLRVSYAGMESQSATLNVLPGGVASKDFDLSFARGQSTLEAEVVKLDKFVVESTALSAAAAAVNEQKMAPNLKNVIVLDEIGDLGDGNIGEYMKYTPGISISFGPQTAASASIRGMPGSGVIFMVDGAQVSSPSGIDLRPGGEFSRQRRPDRDHQVPP